MDVHNPLYNLYERHLRSQLSSGIIPVHVGVILDGNRRWARSVGASATRGHQAGAGKITDFLGWAEEVDVKIVTLWMLSTDNLNRDQDELDRLFEIIKETVSSLAKARKWKITIVGDLGLLSPSLSQDLSAAEEFTKNIQGLTVNIAVGYGGRHEIADAVRSLLRDAAAQGRTLTDVANTLTDEDIAGHLYTSGQPDPDLVIRTSGEQRLSGFMLWQTAHSEFYFCEAYWPDFRRVDFLRALRSYAQRERRRGL